MKLEQRLEARRLREQDGMSIKAIAARVGVSPGSVSRWTRDIELTPQQHERLRQANPIYNGQLRGQEGRRRSARAARVEAQSHGRELARRSGGLLHAQGCMLYWAEGSKDRNVAAVTNSDADLLALFLRFLRECYEVPDQRIALTVNCHLNNGLTVAEIEAWWLERLGLPAPCARTSIVNRPSAASRRRRGNVLLYGTARISVCSTFLVQSIYGAIQEYAGFDRPSWLG